MNEEVRKPDRIASIDALRAIFFLWIFFVDIKVLRTIAVDQKYPDSILAFPYDHYFKH